MNCDFFDQNLICCKAYPLGIKIPQPYEIEHFCKTGSYKFCCWHPDNDISIEKEVIRNLKNISPDIDIDEDCLAKS
ncbi:MAG: hypothetical protein PHQ54_04825 [Candidatus Omnitrophica bacterium]|nr:hypothetical protein [Candidatus Omnitrophota bacterium]